jgi:hypothetical protein
MIFKFYCCTVSLTLNTNTLYCTALRGKWAKISLNVNTAGIVPKGSRRVSRQFQRTLLRYFLLWFLFIQQLFRVLRNICAQKLVRIDQIFVELLISNKIPWWYSLLRTRDSLEYSQRPTTPAVVNEYKIY